MSKLFYPAIFHEAEEGGFWVSFPDFPECFTDGDNMERGFEMAVDALGLAIRSRKKEGQEIPFPSSITKLSADNRVFVIVEFDMMEDQTN